MANISTKHGQLTYETRGQGEPLLLIHSGYLDGNSWQSVCDQFAQYYQVITVDLRGHGASSRQGELSLTAHAADMIALLDALNAPTAYICGHSYGAKIAQCLALDHPTRVKSLVLADSLDANPSGLGGWLATQRVLFRTRSKGVVKLAQGFAFAQGDLTPAVKDYLLSTIGKYATEKATFMRITAAILSAKGEADVSQIRRRTLIIVGAHEAAAVQRARNLANRMSVAHLAIIENAGHMLQWDQPAEFYRIVHDFLGRVI
jgi:non-heme chloroperoxidase